MILGPEHIVRATLYRFGAAYGIERVNVCAGPAGEPPMVHLYGAAVSGVMIAGDVLWIEYQNRRRERLVCYQRRDGASDFISTRIGWERAA